MTAPDLYVVAAGNGSRMNSKLPKALVPITDEPCLTATLQQIGDKFRRVFVVTNVSASEAWQTYFRALEADYPEIAGRVLNVPIESGLGDGHATLQGLIAAEEAEGDGGLSQDIIVAWGDVFFQHAEIIDELFTAPPGVSGLLPAVHEPNPYVALLVNEQMQCVSADFAKYGETHAAGFHDQSVFRFARHRLKQALREIHNTLWKGRRYLSASGEFSLLYSFHHLFNAGDPVYVYETRYPTLSFNTVEEVAHVQREISMRWNSRRQVRKS